MWYSDYNIYIIPIYLYIIMFATHIILYALWKFYFLFNEQLKREHLIRHYHYHAELTIYKISIKYWNISSVRRRFYAIPNIYITRILYYIIVFFLSYITFETFSIRYNRLFSYKLYIYNNIYYYIEVHSRRGSTIVLYKTI